MKRTLSLMLLLTVGGILKAQTGPSLLDYNAWPANNAYNQVRFNQSSGATSILIYNIAAGDQNTLIASSTITGTLNGNQITNNDLSGYTGDIDKAVNALTIKLDLLLKSMSANDVVTLTFKKGNITVVYTIIYDSSTSILAQLTAKQLHDYQSQVLMPQYIKTDVGYKYRYVKPDMDHPDSIKKYGKTKVNGKTITTYTSDQLSDANNHLLDNYTIHIFLDQYGNNLFASTPTGIQQKYHYMLHIIVPNTVASKLHYSITVSSGSLTDVGTSYNSSVSPNPTSVPGVTKIKGGNDGQPDWYEFKYNMFPTTDDLVYSITLKADGYDAANFTKTYTIKKTSFYRGSFDVGVFKTWLSDPTYTLINTPNPAPMTTEKQVSESDR